MTVMTQDEIEELCAALMLEHEALMHRAGVDMSDPEAMLYSGGSPVRKVKDITSPSRKAAEALIALHQQLADAQAAQTLVVGRAEKALKEADLPFGYEKAVSVIRALADPSGVEALAALRAERDAAQQTATERLRQIDDLASQLVQFRASEKELSDAYLRIRAKLQAWDTKPGGADRFEVTEAALDALVADLAAAEARVGALTEAAEYILDGMGIDGPDYKIDPTDDYADAATSHWVKDVLTRLSAALTTPAEETKG